MLAIQIVNGLTEGMMIFLIASGLTLIFGITRIVNFAHGSFYMLGAFLSYTLVPLLHPGSMLGFAVSVVVAALVVAVLGALFEMLVLRRVYASADLMQLVVTVALVLVVRSVVRTIWGPDNVVVPMPDALAGGLSVGDSTFPVFPLAAFAVGVAVLAAMVAVIRFTRAGILLRAATDDRGMVALLGINQARIFTGVFAAGSFLAALAGGLAAPYGNVNFMLDTTMIVTAFVVVVIGGLGSLYGALVAALAVGVLKGVSVLYAPRLSMVLIFAIMAGVLIVRSLGRQPVVK